MSNSKTSSFGTVSREGHDARPFYKRSLYKSILISSSASANKGVARKTPKELNVLYAAESRNMRPHIPDSSIHLMITSPPYNVGKDYDDDLSLTEYRSLLKDVLTETYRVLVDGGRACINIANIGRKPYIPLHAYLIEIAQECGFFMRGEIIWDKGASAGSSCAWGSWRSASNPVLRDIHEYILIFCKGSFKRQRPAQHQKIDRANFLECTKSIWRFPAASAKRAGHPAPFPMELPRRLIELYSYAGDIILDPFIGSGTTAIAALQTDRSYIGYEINPQYVGIANQRITRWEKNENKNKLPVTHLKNPRTGLAAGFGCKVRQLFKLSSLFISR